MRIDFHLHTYHSDGTLTPGQLLAAVRSEGVDRFAVTDHDTLRGYDALCSEDGIIPGVEITAGHDGREIHIVGLGIDPTHSDLQQLLSDIRAMRLRRLAVLIERLPDDVRRGLDLDAVRNDPSARASDTLGRLHLAKALIRRGGVSSIQDAFACYLGDDYTADAGLEPFPRITDVANTIRAAAGVALLAHPGIYGTLANITPLLDQGLDGLEVNHPNLDPSLHAELLTTARERNLLISSGSDLHYLGARRPGAWSLDDLHTPLLERLNAA